MLSAVIVIGGAGCATLNQDSTSTKSMIQSVTGLGDKAGDTNLPEQVQASVMREADLYVGAVAQATDDFRKRVPTIEARNMGQQWKLTEATAAYINATGEHPSMNAVDMLVLATMSRYVVEDYWVGEKFGDAARPLLETHRQLESNAWNIVQMILTPDQREEIRKLLEEYRRRYPHLRYIAAVRVPELAGMLGKLPSQVERSQRSGSLFNLLYLNPLAGLDPTTQAIQQTRLLAARMMYYVQRAPALLGWQTEMTLYQLAVQPESQQVLSNLNEFTQSTKIFAQTAEKLPQVINDQREAAIKQLFSELQKNEQQLGNTLTNLRQTLVAGNEMAVSVNAAVKSLDTFVQTVTATNSDSAAADTNSPPFNINDYANAATAIGTAAQQLNTLLLTADATTTQLVSRTGTETKEIVDYAFRRGMWFLAIALASIVVAALAYRGLARAFFRSK
jgi:hypothetical protein